MFGQVIEGTVVMLLDLYTGCDIFEERETDAVQRSRFVCCIQIRMPCFNEYDWSIENLICLHKCFGTSFKLLETRRCNSKTPKLEEVHRLPEESWNRSLRASRHGNVRNRRRMNEVNIWDPTTFHEWL